MFTKLASRHNYKGSRLTASCCFGDNKHFHQEYLIGHSIKKKVKYKQLLKDEKKLWIFTSCGDNFSFLNSNLWKNFFYNK